MKLFRVLLAILFGVVLLMSCVPASNALAYSSFVPQADSVFRITFEYPSSWVWKIYDDDIQTGFGLITTTNPDFVIEHSNSRDGIDPNVWQGGISISVASYESPSIAITEMDISISSLLEAKAVMRDDILSDRTLKIDGYEARQFSVKSPPAVVLGQEEPLITECVYVLVENKYYVINFGIVESKRSSEFGKGFDHMIESIEFVP